MTAALYDGGREGFLGAEIDWDADDIRMILVDTALYTVNLASHRNLDDVPAGARVKVSGSLINKTKTAGVADADDTPILNVTGATAEALILYQHTGVEGTSRLIMYTDEATNLPYLPNGGDIESRWDDGPNKIFKL